MKPGGGSSLVAFSLIMISVQVTFPEEQVLAMTGFIGIATVVHYFKVSKKLQ